MTKAKTTVEVFRQLPKVLDAETRLKKAGMTEAWWNGLLERIVALPQKYEAITQETRAEAGDRRAKLGNKMRALAEDLRQDPEAAYYYPDYSAGTAREPYLKLFQGHPQALSLSDWLDECAESLEAGSSFDEISRPLENRRGAKFEPYVIRGIYHWIDFYLRIGRDVKLVSKERSHNIETALLASALLGEDIPSNRVTRLREDDRRKYYKE